ncbi:MAG: AAA family ATPase [Nanobdellota archaeon]
MPRTKKNTSKKSRSSHSKKKTTSRKKTAARRTKTKTIPRTQSTTARRTQSPEKRKGPGRPSKKKTASKKTTTKRGRGRPPKKTAKGSTAARRTQSPVKRKGPGRPPKKTTTSKKKTAGRRTQPTTARRSPSPKKQKRGPGRPPKKSTSTMQDSAVTRLLDELEKIKEDNKRLSEKVNDINTEQQVQAQPLVSESRKPEAQNIVHEVEELEESLEENDVNKSNILSKLKNIISKSKKEENPSDEKTTDTQDQTSEDTEQQNDSITMNISDIPNENSSDEKTEQGQDDAMDQQKEDEPEPQKELDPKEYQSKSKSGVISIEKCELYSEALKQVLREIAKVFIGQTHVTERVILSLMCDAHTLMEGVPGLAKTLLVETMNKTISGTSFKRIQFLPDLLPADVIGGQIYNPKTAKFTTYKGPIFANFVLADEINRAPPKTHAAVMEAMQEKKINIENDQFILDRPFLVLATQNPLENKGTYSLPEAVLDRFMFKVDLSYPERHDELKIITENATTKSQTIHKQVKQVLSKEELLKIQSEVKNVYLSQKIRTYILDIVEATRGINKNIEGTRFIKYGAGVRASIYLGAAAKAKAMMEGRNYVLPDDVRFVAPAILRHRVSMNYRGKAHNISSDKIVEEVLAKVDAI